jgi:hypothetical protein
MADQINTLPWEGFAYKITDRPCSHHKDGRHIGDCSVCVRDVLVEVAKQAALKEKKQGDGYLAILGAIRAVLILDQGDKMSPEVRKALWLDHEVALDLQRVRREVVEAAKALDQQYVKWPDMGLAGLRMQEALTALAATELARKQKGLPLETRIITEDLVQHECAGDLACRNCDNYFCSECRPENTCMNCGAGLTKEG